MNCFNMEFQARVIWSSEITLITFHFAIFLMDNNAMFFETLFHAKGFTTNITDERLLTFMNNQDMLVPPVFWSVK